MKPAFVYAGQGSQKTGMGQDFYEHYPAYREQIDMLPGADEIKEISFAGPAEKLAQTRYTQPCMVAFAVGVTRLLYERGICPAMAAGLSLGEYSALFAAGAFTARQAVELVHFRANAMEKAALGIDCKMVAVLGAELEALEQACQQAQEIGVAEIANLNYPGQIVISGERQAVEKVEEIMKAAGIKRCLELNVSGPFHTSLMRPAGEMLRQKLQDCDIKELELPVVFNASGLPLQDGENVKEMLVRQVQSRVLFEKTIYTMRATGAETVVEIGPGKALSGFIRRIDPKIKCLVIEDVPSLEKAIEELSDTQRKKRGA